MLKKLTLATIASSMLVGGVASAAPPPDQQFNLDASGAVGANVDSGNIRNTTKQKHVVFQDCTPNCVPFELDFDFWKTQNYDNDVLGSDCFGKTPIQGAIHVNETKQGTAEAVFWFSSEYEPGGFEIKYMLTLTAPVWVDLDPRTGDPRLVTYPPPNIGDKAIMLATAWEMETEGKGKSRNSSCKGTGVWLNGDQNAPLLIVEQIPLRVDP